MIAKGQGITLHTLMMKALPPQQAITIYKIIKKTKLSMKQDCDYASQLELFWAKQLAILTKVGFIPMCAFVTAFDFPVIQVAAARTAANIQLIADCLADQTITELLDTGQLRDDNIEYADPTGVTPPIFKQKSHAGAVGKINMPYRAMRKSISAYSQQIYATLRYYEAKHASLKLLYDDQASGWAMQTVGLWGLFANPAAIALNMIALPSVAKQVTNLLKGLGANSSLHGAVLCEMDTLRGRGVGAVSLGQEIRVRCDAQQLNCYKPDMSALKQAITAVLDDELPREHRSVIWEDVEHFWQRRCAHTSNGSHHDHRFRCTVSVASQQTRRSAMEQVEENLITNWDGKAYFTPSIKLEHGKSRALFSADTSSYYAFSHLLTTVERKWKHYKVILDPGRGGSYGIVERIKRAGAKIHLMLDYTDFNSQHTIEAQKMVIKLTAEALGYPNRLLNKLVESFDNMYIIHQLNDNRSRGRHVRTSHVAGTLMSGHRATSYINSVLNRAYLLCVSRSMSSTYSCHVGDDVYIASPDLGYAAQLLQACRTAGLRFNPIKQSVGPVCFEFLRAATHGNTTYMYAARCVSAFISGNWTSDMKLTPDEAVANMVRAAWTFNNRTGCLGKGIILALPIRILLKICMDDAVGIAGGTISVNGGPVRYATDAIKVCTITRDDNTDGGRMRRKLASLPDNARYATTAYLKNCLTRYDSAAILITRRKPNLSMLRASYAKALTIGGGERGGKLSVRVTTQHVNIKGVTVLSRELLVKPYNILNPSFVADLLIPTMSTKEVDEFVTITGVPQWCVDELRRTKRTMPNIIITPVGYSDAASLRCKHDEAVAIQHHHAYYI